jgi:hypothetical protein
VLAIEAEYQTKRRPIYVERSTVGCDALWRDGCLVGVAEGALDTCRLLLCLPTCLSAHTSIMAGHGTGWLSFGLGNT